MHSEEALREDGIRSGPIRRQLLYGQAPEPREKERARPELPFIALPVLHGFSSFFMGWLLKGLPGQRPAHPPASAAPEGAAREGGRLAPAVRYDI